MSKYTELTLKYLRDRGWKCQVVERYQWHAKRRIDLFGIIDIIAIQDNRIAGIQSTSHGGRRDHIIKIIETESENLKGWLDSGAEFYLICWKKQKLKRGGVAFRYAPVIDGWIRKLGKSGDLTLSLEEIGSSRS